MKQWVVRRVECIRGKVTIGEAPSRDFRRCQRHPVQILTIFLDVEIFPAFDYARATHDVVIHIATRSHGEEQSKTVSFVSQDVKLQLDVSIDKGDETQESCPIVQFRKQRHKQMLGDGVVARIELEEGQRISFVLRDDIPNHVTQNVTTALLDTQQYDTLKFWSDWLKKSIYTGRWREVVNRSLMILKLLTYEPTGAIVAAPTFSVPEAIGGVR